LQLLSPAAASGNLAMAKFVFSLAGYPYDESKYNHEINTVMLAAVSGKSLEVS